MNIETIIQVLAAVVALALLFFFIVLPIIEHMVKAAILKQLPIGSKWVSPGGFTYEIIGYKAYGWITVRSKIGEFDQLAAQFLAVMRPIGE